MCLETTSTNNKTIALIRQGYRVFAEYQLIEQEQLRGIYAIPSYFSGLLWFGVIFIHSGLYAESAFRFSILLPENFPNDLTLPTVIFQKDIYHPHICPLSHSLDLTPLFSAWRKDEHHIWHILKYIQAIFADPEGSVCTRQTNDGQTIALSEVNNMEALLLLSKSRVDYSKRVKKSIAWSCKHMFDTPPIKDPHYIVFERYTPDRHQPVIQRLKSQSWYQLRSQSAASPSVCVARIESTRELLLEEQQTNVADSSLN
ncbi:protein crossbronx-like [Drosophila busckii]|uniref:protein crossbronx-like n=1 Tax=Drosophila busckii TaxID=30019 RepID=UPI00083EB70A|nr:protein crossbronx-like [Drosophila busckii]XP_017836329.1 protein crossbronx-like [Drosophila busckii]